MEQITYPLLYFELEDKSILGILVGTQYQAIEKDLKTVKSVIHSYLAKQYKKYEDYPYPSFSSFRLKTYEVSVRPMYRSQDYSFPVAKSLKVPIVAIFGPAAEEQYYECHLPILQEQFNYNDPKLLDSLIKNFATNTLNQRSPEDIFRMIIASPPQLDSISLKIKPHRKDSFGSNWNFSERVDTLSSMAEKYPFSRAIQRNINKFPEAAWELENQVKEVMDLMLNTRSNVLLVGGSGVGKSAVLKQAIKKVKKSSSLNITFWRLVGQRITARAKYLGEWQKNVEQLVYELQLVNGVLWVTDILQLMQIGGEGPEDSVAAFMTSFLQMGKIQIVGELSPTELESMRRLLPGFIENFQIVELEELPQKSIFNILDKFSDYLAQNLKFQLSKSAQELAYRLLLRYYPYESFPGKAIKFLGECINEAELNDQKHIDNQIVIQNFIKQTGMPELFLRDDQILDVEELAADFKSKIIGQSEAIDALCNIVKVFKAGLNNPYKPISTMIFAGPTGVGKTAATKVLAEYFFGKGQKKSPLVRIDMSEFQHPAQLARFIGAGGEVGKLVQDIRERPFAVLLLDEIEKADPSVFDALLTVLDEGRLVDAYGRVTNFRNTIIIMTSNLGASNHASIGFGGAADTNYESAIGKFFRPEFVNRIDQIVTFNALSASNILKITAKELEELAGREGFEKRGIQLAFSEALQKHLAELGFDERYGARPLQRTIEQKIIAPLANWLLNHPKIENTKLYLDIDGMELKIAVKN
jgi:ATP-dependent Clp protease ATP-binding subunit ClpC